MNIKLNQKRAGLTMKKDNSILPSALLVEKETRTISEPKCGLLNTVKSACQIRFHTMENSAVLDIPQDWRGIIMMNRVSMAIVAGEAVYQELPLFALVKLQVFIDESRGLALKYEQQQPWKTVQLSADPQVERNADVERWLLSLHHSQPDEMSALADFLRRTEYYWLISFLLNESTNSEKLQDLGMRYGLSYSHFRRLCRNALGNSAKNEMRGWRIARALLDAVEERQSLTEVAMRHGYASSSHLSNDIRDVFGVSPRGIWNIIEKKSQI